MSKELENTLLVDGEEYNINAKQAEKVKHGLTLKKNLLTTINENDVFDGQEALTIDYVPATGGRFTGKVRLPANPDTINNEDVLNYGDLKDKVLVELINNSVLYSWNGTKLTGGGESQAGTIQSICIVVGSDSNVNALAEYIYKNKPVSAYIYVDSDTGNIYFGTCNSNKVTSVKVSSEYAITATRLANARKFSVSLESDSAVAFDGSGDVALGVTGALPIAKGGTDATTAAEARTNLGLATVAATGKYSDLIDKPNYAGSSTAGGAATSALTATKATQDANGNTITTYYQKKITISANAPSGGANGDIWIKY